LASFNLIDESWLPVRLSDGTRRLIAPWQITEKSSGNPAVAIDWPRPDFNGAALEFLIGLLSTAFAPQNEDEWHARWERPPAPEQLRAAFQVIAFAFDLDGDGPRFMQDFDPLPDVDAGEVAALLIDQPGDQTLRYNKDLFVKRGSVGPLSRAAAAMTLYTLQSYAPSGGKGHRTSMRGGGPLTTLVWAERRGIKAELWDLLWPNVCIAEAAIWPKTAARVFPWLARTRTSENDGATTPQQAHRLQAFWGMPRRIRLVFERADNRRCSLTGLSDEYLVTSFRMKNLGIKYEGWLHPLSPYSLTKTTEPPNAMKARPGCVSYRSWLGIVQEDKEHGRHPAPCVDSFRSKLASDCDDLSGSRLIAFGYDMDNMKARSWYEGEMPVPLASPDMREILDARAVQLIRAADLAARATKTAVRNACFREGDPRRKRAYDLSFIVEVGDTLWRRTEADFYECLARLAADPTDSDLSQREEWLRRLRRTALTIFDEAVPSDGLEAGHWRRLVEARQSLVWNLDGHVIRAELGLSDSKPERQKASRKKGGG
jgi:CRISPR system Cascade subunit CasA